MAQPPRSVRASRSPCAAAAGRLVRFGRLHRDGGRGRCGGDGDASPRRPSPRWRSPLTVQSRDGGASAADHSEIPASLLFRAGVGRRSFTVTATDDTVDEVGESITLALGTLPEGYSAGLGTAIVSLVDNDETVYFDASAYTATEGGTDATVTATLSAAPSSAIQVPITVTPKRRHRGGLLGRTGDAELRRDADDHDVHRRRHRRHGRRRRRKHRDRARRPARPLPARPGPGGHRGARGQRRAAGDERDLVHDLGHRLHPHGGRLHVRRHGRGFACEREDRLAAGRRHADARRFADRHDGRAEDRHPGRSSTRASWCTPRPRARPATTRSSSRSG